MTEKVELLILVLEQVHQSRNLVAAYLAVLIVQIRVSNGLFEVIRALY